jgi:SNF2 family DNA or RNA helicase
MLSIDDLYNYQRHCVDLMINNNKFGFFLDMGGGKTIITLTAIYKMMVQDIEVNKPLIVGTKRVIESVWLQESKNWTHTKDFTFSAIHGTEKQRIKAINTEADIYLVSRDNIAWLCNYFGGLKLPYDMVVLDESSSYKNNASIRFKALRKATVNTSRIYLLTGTPAPNSLMDLWAQIFLLDRGERLSKFITHYREAYFTRSYDGWSYDCSKKSQNDIHTKIKDICISLSTEDFGTDLPELRSIHMDVNLSPAMKRKYKKFESDRVLEFIEKDEPLTAANAAALTNKLLQFANGAIYSNAELIKDRETIHLHNFKLDALAEVVEEQNGKPVIVAYSYKHDLERILKRFKKLNPKTLKDKNAVEDWNAGKIKLLALHPASGGHGLNLQHGGSCIVWFGLNWSLELYQQLNKRIHRPGQKETCRIIHLIAKGTNDERVIQVLSKKDKGQKALLNSVKALIKHYKH